MIIAFMGNDGSGKTTLARKTYNFFKELGFSVIYKHEYEYSILKVFLHFLGKKHRNAKKEMIAGRSKSRIYYLWPYIVWFDLIVQYLYLRLFKRKSIVIFDRFLFDQYLSFKYLNLLTKISDWLYKHSPRPDILIILQVEPKIAFNRKRADHPIEIYSLKFYERQTKAYVNLSCIFNIPVISTMTTVECSFREVLRVIFHNSSMLNHFIYHCRLNKILYFSLSAFNLCELNNVFKTYHQLYQIRERVYHNILDYVKATNALEQKIIIKDPPRNFPWVPEKDVDLIILEDLQISNNILDKWKKAFEIDIIPIKKVEYLIKVIGSIELNRLKLNMPEEFLLGMILINGLIRLDEYMLLKQQIEKIKPNDRGLTLIKDYIIKLNKQDTSFPHFISFIVLMKALSLSSFSNLYKIKVLSLSLISRIYYRTTNKLLFHSLKEMTTNDL
jgi:thymidylate kinase